jgi:hypothetical protein
MIVNFNSAYPISLAGGKEAIEAPANIPGPRNGHSNREYERTRGESNSLRSKRRVVFDAAENETYNGSQQKNRSEPEHQTSRELLQSMESECPFVVC